LFDAARDGEFVRAFLAGKLPPEQFHHRDHLRLAWWLIRERGVAEASSAVAEAIQRFAAQHGHATKYHETLTQFWVRIVAHVMAVHPDITAFDGLLATFPHLLDKDLPLRHWRGETIWGPEARARWVEPDLLALPTDA
jgi:hypothetical protein